MRAVALGQKSLETLAYCVNQCFSTFLLQRNLAQMFALLVEPYAKIQVSILLQPHKTVVANFVAGTFGPFRRNPEVPRNSG